MYEFDFWYAYFDSVFLKNTPQLHSSFIQTFDLYELGKLTFPQCKKLPQISKCFQQFQKFIFTSETWIECECDQIILTEIQDSVNLCVILIRIEKKYGQDFWHLKRRIQASICHFFAILLFLLNSLIPDNTLQTIDQTKKINKLCTTISALQNFINRILPEMNSIIKFLYQESFSQEKKLTVLFLQQIKQVLLTLPQINRKKIGYQFQLSKYLYLVIPIELSKNQYKFKTKRKKAATISNQIQIKYHSDEFVSKQSEKASIQQNSDQKRKFSLSKLNEKKQKQIYRTKIVKNKQIVNNYEAIHQNFSQTNQFLPKLFQFSEKVRKCSFYVSQKKITKATLNTRETMEMKISVQKSRKISDFGKKSETYSKDKEIGRTFSIQKKRQKTIETVRSKKSSFYKVHRKTEIQQSQKLRHHKQKSLAKDKVKKSFTIEEIIQKPYEENPLELPMKKINFYEGKSKGWGVIQDELNKKNVLKGIQKLIHSSQFY